VEPYLYQGTKDLEIELRSPFQAEVIADLTKAKMNGLTTISYSASDALEVYRYLRIVLYLVNSSMIP
jgi:D-aminopeptidase